jgi:hypothetical protein
MEVGIMELLAMSLPTIIMAIVAYYFINIHIKSVNNQNKFEVIVQQKKEGLLIKLQAYERMVLFCDRVNPIKLLVRIKPIDSTTEGYLHLLLKNIEQEFEHNSVQQIYISEECWKVIITVKSAIINKLKQVASVSENAQELREKMMITYQTSTPPTDTAIVFIKNEVNKIIS